jgi:phage terminase large subunit-like protein
MNLHEVVAGAIGSVNRHEMITLWRCTGVSNVKGVITPAYEKSTVRAQIQRPNAADLELNERVAKAEQSIKVWLNAPADTINRVDQSAGDIIQRADGTYWLIVAIRESYATEGWLSVLAVEHVEPPKGVDDNAD